MLIVLGLLGAAVVFAVGYVVGSGGAGSASITVSTDAGGGTPCESLCRTWKLRRAEACTALLASAMAASALVAANALLTRAAITAALLLAAAVAAQAIPFIGSWISASLFAAYATAQVAVIYLAGSAAGAANTATGAANEVTRALAEVAKAEAALREGCTDPTALAACLATPSPCAGVP
jgi:hypothetical protein